MSPIRLFKLLVASILLIASSAVSAQSVCRDVSITWTPPDTSNLPTTPPVGAPPDWIPPTITGYRIIYSYDGGPESVVEINGYDTAQHTLAGSPCGNISVYMLSYCPDCDIQLSDPSNTVVQVIEPITQPDPPAVIDLTPLISGLVPGKHPFTVTVAGIEYEGQCNYRPQNKFRFVCRGQPAE